MKIFIHVGIRGNVNFDGESWITNIELSPSKSLLLSSYIHTHTSK